MESKIKFKFILELYLLLFLPSNSYTYDSALGEDVTAAGPAGGGFNGLLFGPRLIAVTPGSTSRVAESKNSKFANLKSKFESSNNVTWELTSNALENSPLELNGNLMSSNTDRKLSNTKTLDVQFLDYPFLSATIPNEELNIAQTTECEGAQSESRDTTNADGRCFLRKMPNESCDQSEECADVGGVAYYCIQKRCALPLECPPGHAHVGPSCVPFAVTGGECAHPIQCLTGSLCMRGKCRGPCDDNQLFVDDECVDYEGAGCIARSCVDGVCPRAFPTCNWVPQKKNYLCCERAIRMSEQCPHPSSVPQVDLHTGEIAHCFDNNCAPGYACQFSRYRHGSYICCSNLPTDFPLTSGVAAQPKDGERISKPNGGSYQSLRKSTPDIESNGHPKLPPSSSSSIEILKRCCADAECLRKHPRIQIICVRIFPQPPRILGLDP